MTGGAFGRAPERDRPSTPGSSYGVPSSGGAFIDWEHVVQRLLSAPAYWLATVSPMSRPQVVPVWGVLVSGDLYLEIGSTRTSKGQNLEIHPDIQVHLDDSDDVVIIRGLAVATRPSATLGAAIAAEMKRKYVGYGPEPDEWDVGGLIRVAPRIVLAWRDMPTATRWVYPTGGSTPTSP